MKYNRDQHGEYLRMMDRIGDNWIRMFEGDTHFYSAVYWDLLTYLWAEGGGARKTDALRSMKSVKSAHTAGKYVEAAIRKGILKERENPEDARSKLLVLAPRTQSRLDLFFDAAVGELRRSLESIRRKGRLAKTP